MLDGILLSLPILLKKYKYSNSPVKYTDLNYLDKHFYDAIKELKLKSKF